MGKKDFPPPVEKMNICSREHRLLLQLSAAAVAAQHRCRLVAR